MNPAGIGKVWLESLEWLRWRSVGCAGETNVYLSRKVCVTGAWWYVSGHVYVRSALGPAIQVLNSENVIWVNTWTAWGHLHGSWERMVGRRTAGQVTFGLSVASEETFLSARDGYIYFLYIYFPFINQPVRSADAEEAAGLYLCQGLILPTGLLPSWRPSSPSAAESSSAFCLWSLPWPTCLSCFQKEKVSHKQAFCLLCYPLRP